MEDDDDDLEERGDLIPGRTKSWVVGEVVGEGPPLDMILPLVILAALSIGVVLYNFLRQQWEPCDLGKPLAKHFYCFNASKPPGFHIDTPAGDLRHPTRL